MNAPRRTDDDYRLEVENLDGTVVARHGDIVLAESRRARMMYETRLPPVVYFPRADVAVDLQEQSELRTFCPFKGSATYFDLAVGGERLKRAAWSYFPAHEEGKPIEGMIAFGTSPEIALDLGGNVPRPAHDRGMAGPTVNWLLREAGQCQSAEELTAAFGERLNRDGIVVSRLGVLIWSLHPLIVGRSYRWTRADGKVSTSTPDHNMLTRDAFINSPMRHVANGLGGVRQRLDGRPIEFDFPIIEELRAAGATDYVAMPLAFSGGPMNVLTLACDHPDGFTTSNLGLVFECSHLLAKLYEVFALRDNARSLLETYLGRRTGARVLGGSIRRGDGDEIDAAILFCDLRHSTVLESRLGRRDYLDLLNGFFETVSDIVTENGGEVLKFIGDAVLAIFPASGEKGQACRQATVSARKIVARLAEASAGPASEPLECAIGISFGTVTYGNVGSRERLDFTVIGAAANVAARLADYGKNIGQRIVVAEDALAGDPASECLGEIDLRNVRDPVPAYALTDTRRPSD